MVFLAFLPKNKSRKDVRALAHQNRTIAIAGDFRVDGAKSPEILQKEGVSSGAEKGVITKGVFSLEKSLESLKSLKSLSSLESLENGRILLCFPQSGGSLESLESLKSLESLENGLF